MDNFKTLPEALSYLSNQGYTSNFSLHPSRDCLVCRKTTRHLSPDEFEIDEVYYFEEATETVVFALSSMKYNIKGIVVNAISMNTNATNPKTIEKLKIHLESQWN